MTELHHNNVNAELHRIADRFERARTEADWNAAEKIRLELFRILDHVMRESRGSRIEAEALATELLVYRPTRSERPPAPLLNGYAYVFTAKFPWVCAAAELREVLSIPGNVGTFRVGYTQDHYVPDRKTICGKATAFPVSERFTSGGWPRLHELCPDCTQLLAKRGLLGADETAGKQQEFGFAN